VTSIDGWILDVGTCKDGVTVWVKSGDGSVHQIIAPYQPTLYVLPRQGGSSTAPFDIARGLESSLDIVASARVVQRRVHVDDPDDTPVVQVCVRDPPSFKKLVALLSAPSDFDLFNVDIPVFQKFLYETKLFPFARATFDVSERGSSLVLDGFTLRDDKTQLVYCLPQLKTAWLEVMPRAESTVTSGRMDNPIQKVALLPYDEPYKHAKPTEPWLEPFKLERGPGVDEASLVAALVNEVRAADPDIILTRGGDEHVFPYLCSRASALGLTRSVVLSRTRRHLASECFRASNDGDGSFFSYGHVLHRGQTSYYLSGRLHVDASLYGSLHFQDGNIPGLIEVARVSSVPVQRLNRITIGGALQSIQFQIAHDRGILIPREKRHGAETFKTVNTLLLADRGGHIFEPRTGVFDHVISLDFTSMYPMIMEKFNVSPETVNCSCCDPSENVIPGLGYHVCTKHRGLIPDSIALPLHKRIAYKHMARKLGDERGLKIEHMQAALKWILVVSFGYLGFRNARFGRVEAHQAVCAYSREMLLQAARVAREHGLDVIHGIVDSLWVKDNRQEPAEDLDAVARELCAEIEKATGLPIESDGVFRFIIFLPSVLNREVGTLNHYWGVFTSGKVKVRGIEMRRRDSPRIVKAMQKDVITALAPATSKDEFMARMPRARAVLARYIDAVERGDVDPAQLVVTTSVSKDPATYKVDTYQAVAAKQLGQHGATVCAGQQVQYIITNAASSRANERVMAWDLFVDGHARPDGTKYKELLERAFANLFPFDVNAVLNTKNRASNRTLDTWFQE